MCDTLKTGDRVLIVRTTHESSLAVAIDRTGNVGKIVRKGKGTSLCAVTVDIEMGGLSIDESFENFIFFCDELQKI